jgi:HEAT repeat protein
MLKQTPMEKTLKLTFIKCGLAFALLLGCLPRLLIAQEAKEDNIAWQINSLSNHHTKEVRLAATKSLLRLRDEPNAKNALNALVLCMSDQDKEIRRDALITLSEIALAHRQVCPLTVAAAMLDPENEVRDFALTYCPMFSKQQKDAIPILLKATEHKDAPVRAAALIPLVVAAAGRDPKVIAALDKACKDTNLLVQCNAYAAYCQLTGDMKVSLRFWLLAVEQARANAGLANGKKDNDREAVSIASALKLRDLGAKQPAEFVTAVSDLLADQSALTRKAAVHALDVPVRIVVAVFAKLKMYRIWVGKGLFAELLGILEEVGAA